MLGSWGAAQGLVEGAGKPWGLLSRGGALSAVAWDNQFCSILCPLRPRAWFSRPSSSIIGAMQGSLCKIVYWKTSSYIAQDPESLVGFICIAGTQPD